MSDSKRMEELQRELDTLREREKSCATMGGAQKVAIVRAFQECCDALGIDSMRTSPADLVREVVRRCSVRPADGQKYRLVTNGERFEFGDESLDDNCDTWRKIRRSTAQYRIASDIFPPTRRPIP